MHAYRLTANDRPTKIDMHVLAVQARPIAVIVDYGQILSDPPPRWCDIFMGIWNCLPLLKSNTLEHLAMLLYESCRYRLSSAQNQYWLPLRCGVTWRLKYKHCQNPGKGEVLVRLGRGCPQPFRPGLTHVLKTHRRGCGNAQQGRGTPVCPALTVTAAANPVRLSRCLICCRVTVVADLRSTFPHPCGAFSLHMCTLLYVPWPFCFRENDRYFYLQRLTTSPSPKPHLDLLFHDAQPA